MDMVARSVTASTSSSTEEVNMDIFEWMVEHIDTVYRIWVVVMILATAWAVKTLIDLWREDK